MQTFGRLLGIHASAIGHVRVNGDFNLDFAHPELNGAYYQLSDEMRTSLLTYPLNISPDVRKSERTALEKQRKAKRRKQEALREKKLLAAQQEYANALTYIDMFHSTAGWRTVKDARREFAKLTSETARREGLKEQFRMRKVGFGWDDVDCSWSENGIFFQLINS